MNLESEKYYKSNFAIIILNIIIVIFSVLLPSFILWGKRAFILPRQTELVTMLGLIIIISLALVSLKILIKYPGNKSYRFIISMIVSWYSVFFLVLLACRLQYSFSLLLLSIINTLLISFVAYFLFRKLFIPCIAYIPLGDAKNLNKINNIRWICLHDFIFNRNKINYSAIAVDLYTNDLTPECQKFIADSTLAGVPIYNARQLEESLTGRVRIKHMHENDFGSLLPSYIYSILKRIIDIVLVLLLLPIVLPIMFVTAIAIKIESHGKIMFIQKRVGQGGREFNIYKFRSMYQDSEKHGAQFACNNDARITRVGKLIRKIRIDELPQLFNVLKGDMSLIGPRPEQKIFVEQFELNIPFYNYRHIVKPGISGWAQVMQGYTANEDDTKIKIEYDFYYIKNFSIWLDILIFFKTIKTMITGFGAR